MPQFIVSFETYSDNEKFRFISATVESNKELEAIELAIKEINLEYPEIELKLKTVEVLLLVPVSQLPN